MPLAAGTAPGTEPEHNARNTEQQICHSESLESGRRGNLFGRCPTGTIELLSCSELLSAFCSHHLCSWMPGDVFRLAGKAFVNRDTSDNESRVSVDMGHSGVMSDDSAADTVGAERE